MRYPPNETMNGVTPQAKPYYTIPIHEKNQSSHMITGFPLFVYRGRRLINGIRGPDLPSRPIPTMMHHQGHRHQRLIRIIRVRNRGLWRHWRWYVALRRLHLHLLHAQPRRRHLLLRARPTPIAVSVTEATAGNSSWRRIDAILRGRMQR